ncbi:MAG: OadG family protein [Selenomonadaceae bacterium]|nr:OadG family protein [Selenomonadaceae bacterium]
MEHSPVTTNPLIIMVINMTVVFIVLVSLIYLIKLIHFIDPTKEPEKKPEDGVAPGEPPLAVVKSSSPPQISEPAPVDEGISPEVIAAISAAISAYGFSGQVKAVHIVNHEGTPWRASAKFNNLKRK